MLSHELRNPLAPILNSIYILRRQNTAAAPIIEQASATIQRQAMHMKRLVDDLLDVSRIRPRARSSCGRSRSNWPQS